MNDPELDNLLTALRAGGPDFTAPPLVVREGFEQMLATMPVAGDIVFERTDLGGVPTLRAATPTAVKGRALLYMHGGAYVVGSAQGYRGLAAELGRATGATAYAIDYRLAPEHVFPAALDDAVLAYRGLIERGYDPRNIVIAGDSAGGGLALALLVALRDAGLGQAAAALLISPWVDLGCSGGTITSKAAEDPSLTGEGLRAMAGHYLGSARADDPRASPLFADLAGLAPILIQVGSSEILLDDSVRVAGAAGAAGTAVQLEIWPRMVHVWHAFAFMLGAGQRAIAAGGAFLRRRIEESNR